MKKLLGTVLVAAGSIATYELLRRKGIVDEVCGIIKREIGNLTEDRSLEAKGALQQGKGKVKGFVDDVKEGVKDTVEDVRESVEDFVEENTY